MRFAVKTLPFSTHWQGRVFFTAKSINFSMNIDPKITWEPCRKKYNFYFYVTNVFFEAGERGECMETFLGLCRLENEPKITLHFSESITIGISIQNGHLLPRVILASCWPSHRAARKMTSRKSYWVSEGVLHTRAGHAHVPTFCRSSLPGTSCGEKYFFSPRCQ